MTHFYFEFSTKKIDKKINFKKKLKSKFSRVYNIEESNFSLYIGDFIEGSFIIEENDSNIIFQFNKHKYPSLNSESQNNYCPTIIYNKQNRNIEVKTDPFGLDFIYVTVSDNGSICLSSHLKYLLENNSKLLNELDYDAIIEYLFCHCILEHKTIFTKIKLLPYNRKIKFKNWGSNPEEIIERALKKKDFRKTFPTDFDYGIDIQKTSEEIANDFRKLTEQYYKFNENEKIAFYLSGGLDSRTLIATINESLKHKTRAITFDCREDGVDSSNAKEIAKLLKIEHNIRIIDEKDIVKNSYLHMWKNEGLSIHAVSVLLELLDQNSDIKIFIDGYLGDAQFGGEFLKELSENDKKESNKHHLKLLELMQSHEYAFPTKVFSKLVKKEKLDVFEVIRDGFKKHCNLMWEVDNDILLMENLLTQTRGRCLVSGGGIRTTESYGLAITPFYHPDIYQKYIQIPSQYRKDRKFQKLVLNQLNEKLAKQTSTSTKWYRKIKSQRILKFGLKIVYFFERVFNRKLIPIYSTAPFNDWLRKQKSYYDFVKEIFYNEDSLIWNVLEKENTIVFFENFINRKNNYYKFLRNIIDLEILLRIFMSLNGKKNKVFLYSNVIDKKFTFDNKLHLENVMNKLK
ncbi:MAG: hypothetical protein FK730_17255 [Asgard group archaeon]|nr:hypothetical protein [Asgard group archaeon]